MSSTSNMINFAALGLLISTSVVNADLFGDEVPCLTETECDQRRQELGFSTFYVDDYPSKGCFIKGKNAFFSEGTEADMSTSSLPGQQERLWCTATSMAKSALVTNNVCYTEEACDAKRKELGFTTFYVDSTYPTKGCFYKNDKAFFGTGGTEAAMATEDLPGIQQRIWCDVVGTDDDNLEAIDLELEAGDGSRNGAVDGVDDRDVSSSWSYGTSAINAIIAVTVTAFAVYGNGI
mmetsp:Transcript_26363/g.55240  ORF Transcript_26363/g.55240 Transcript_26363/m.55240 type:complete len:235 (-) Transcript_26363:28-732(-)